MWPVRSAFISSDLSTQNTSKHVGSLTTTSEQSDELSRGPGVCTEKVDLDLREPPKNYRRVPIRTSPSGPFGLQGFSALGRNGLLPLEDPTLNPKLLGFRVLGFRVL